MAGWSDEFCEVAVKTEQKISTTVVTETQVEQLSPLEERVLRMRSGARLAPGERLGSKLDFAPPEARAELAARLLLMEAQLLADLAPDSMAEPTESTRKASIIDRLSKLED